MHMWAGLTNNVGMARKYVAIIFLGISGFISIKNMKLLSLLRGTHYRDLATSRIEHGI